MDECEWGDSEGIPVIANPTEIRRFAELLLPPGADYIIEMRALHAPRQGTISGYYDAGHLDQFVDDCDEWSGVAEGLYATLNPVNSQLLARAANWAKSWARHTTSDPDIICRRWLPLDFDPIRPSGISSSDAEHAAAIERAARCRDWLRSREITDESVVMADSGNGSHLLLAVELRNDEASLRLVEDCTTAVGLEFDDSSVKVDSTTGNAARIWKIPGTLAAKGDNVEDRPHRLARLLLVPETVCPIETELLHKLAALVPKPPPSPARPRHGYGRFDLSTWIAEHELPVVQERSWREGHVWVLNPCPWNPSHGNAAAFVVQFSNGAIAAGCHHDGCSGLGWPELRDLFEPGWRDRRRAQLPDDLPPAIARQFRQRRK